jgi:DNA-binding transcriptional ArsR family regulator
LSGLRVIRDVRTAATLLHPMRIRILEHLREADSASGVSRRLNIPRQKVNYHLRQLEARGLLELVGERRVGNCTERLLRAASDGLVLSPRLLGRASADTGPAPEAGAERLLVAAARIQREVGGAEGQKPSDDAHAVELDVALAGPDAARSFAAELGTLARRLAARYAPRPDAAPTHRLLLAVHPKPSFHASLRDPRPPGEAPA